MGYNNENGLPVLFDLETVAHDKAADYLPPPVLDPAVFVPPKNYKKPETIAAWRLEEADRRQAEYLEDLEKCSLDPDLCRIVALGFMSPENREPFVLTCKTEQEERDALGQFWDCIRLTQLIGYNCVGFDVPVLLRRSLLLDVKGTPGLHVTKHRHPGVTDVFELLSHGGMLKWRPQSFYLRRFGLNVHVPTDSVKGSDIAALVKDGMWDLVAHHVRCDVLGLQQLAAFMGLIDLPREAEVF